MPDIEFKEGDDLSMTLMNKKLIEKKPFLRRLYVDFYLRIQACVAPCFERGQKVLEIGSGGGFMGEIIPQVITSDILPVPGLDFHCPATSLPFDDRSLGAICMLNACHHIPRVEDFLKEADRVLMPGGKIVMVEPANTFFRRVIDKRFHHEPFDVKAGWELKEGGPLSTANGALPWIVFSRDRDVFQKKFSGFSVTMVSRHTPFRYLLSGGLTYKQLLPTCFYRGVVGFEWLMTPLMGIFGYFQTIVITKNDTIMVKKGSE